MGLGFLSCFFVDVFDIGKVIVFCYFGLFFNKVGYDYVDLFYFYSVCLLILIMYYFI